jgi:alpha-tubulin N-acetyltransferase 1
MVVGMLKVGHKSLYVFDPNGETQNVVAPCVLDFYVHESRQRAGLGRQLFDYMLEQENISPNQMAIDRPSEKLLGFLRKHYGEFFLFMSKIRLKIVFYFAGLTKKIPQMNNFVVYEGFFMNMQRNDQDRSDRRLHIAAR